MNPAPTGTRRRTRRALLAVLAPAALALGCLAGPAPAWAAPMAGTAATGGGPLNVRSGPSWATTLAGQVANGTALSLACQTTGAYVSGYVRGTARWDRLADGRYVADAYVSRTAVPPDCAAPAPAPVVAAPVPAPAPSTPVPVAGASATGGGPLNVRSGPSWATTLAGQVANGTALSLACQTTGAYVSGYVRDSAMWDRLADGRYVADAYVSRTVAPASCATPGADVAAAVAAAQGTAWVRPVTSAAIGGFRTAARPTHDGVDLMAVRGTPIRAAGAGTVVTVECDVSTGTCDTDGSPQVLGCGWYVEIRHPGALVTRYCHLVTRPSVTLGQAVGTGQVIGYVGSSGNSSAPHLHFEVHTGDPAVRANAIDPVPFMRGVGAPLAGTG